MFVLTVNVASLLLKCFFLKGSLRAVALYPLNGATLGKDISVKRNAPGRIVGVRPAPGPDGTRDGSIQFFGRPSSFIQFPNRGALDTKNSITLLAWIYHEGRSGPIFNYRTNGWGVHFWMVTPRTLFVRFVRRRGHGLVAHVASRKVRPRRWQFVGASYDQATGVAKLFLNSRVIAARRIGRFRLATNFPVRMGARQGDRRYFKGRISCMQVYSVPLTQRQVAARARRCFSKYLCSI